MSFPDFSAERPLLNLKGVSLEQLARNPNSFAQFVSYLNDHQYGMTPNEAAGITIGFVITAFILGIMIGFLMKSHRDTTRLDKRIEALEKHPAIVHYKFVESV